MSDSCLLLWRVSCILLLYFISKKGSDNETICHELTSSIYWYSSGVCLFIVCESTCPVAPSVFCHRCTTDSEFGIDILAKIF